VCTQEDSDAGIAPTVFQLLSTGPYTYGIQYMGTKVRSLRMHTTWCRGLI